jgi:hypothetical protein
MPQLEYQELVKCGHSPWLERQAKGAFFAALDAWLAARLRPSKSIKRGMGSDSV